MLQYLAASVCLRGFSCTAGTRSFYRRLGNRFGGNRRTRGRMPSYYADRLKWMLQLSGNHHFVRNGDRILELGTGWLHWEAISLRLFFEIEAVLFDVWDNRQLGGLKNYLQQLRPMLDHGFELSSEEVERAQSIIDSVLQVDSLSKLYDLLGF